MPTIDSPWYEDKSFKLVLGFIVAMVANMVGRKFGTSLNVEEIVSMAVAVTGFVAGNKWKSGTLAKAQIQASSAAATVQSETDAAKVLAGK